MNDAGPHEQRYLVDALNSIESAAIQLGRAQVEGKRGRRERQALLDGYAQLWERMTPLLAARALQVRQSRRIGTRLVAALISL